MAYQQRGVPLVIFGGKEYGSGSSRDWAAKGVHLLGVKAVIVESFERIHRSNLIGMGVLPLLFEAGTTRQSLGLDGSEVIDLHGIHAMAPRLAVRCTITRADGGKKEIVLTAAVDTLDEVDYYRHGGILHYVLRQRLASETAGTAD
jgi:aconitate hydratase